MNRLAPRESLIPPDLPWPQPLVSPVLQIDLTDDLARFGQKLALLSEKNLRFAVAGALTRAGKVAQQDLLEAMPRHIDRPNRWTMGSTFVQYAKPADLTVEVGIRGQDRAGRTGAAKYLMPLIEGGQPRPKGADLSASKIAGVRGVLVPSQAGPVRLNQYGNVSLSNYAKVLAAARTKGSGVYVAPVRQGSATLAVFQRREGFMRGTSTLQSTTRRLFTIDPNPKRRQQQLPLAQILEGSFLKALPREVQQGLEAELKRLLS